MRATIRLIGMGYEAKQIVPLGESLGSAVAVDLARRRPCAGVILACPFTSFSALPATVMPLVGRLSASGFNRSRFGPSRVLPALTFVQVAGPRYRARLQAFYACILPRPGCQHACTDLI